MNDVAALYGVHPVTVRTWISKGIIAVVRVGPTKRVRIRQSEAAKHFSETPGAKT